MVALAAMAVMVDMAVQEPAQGKVCPVAAELVLDIPRAVKLAGLVELEALVVGSEKPAVELAGAFTDSQVNKVTQVSPLMAKDLLTSLQIPRSLSRLAAQETPETMVTAD